MKVLLGPFRKKGNRTIKVKVHTYDCWNLDHSIAIIAYPLLKKFREADVTRPADMTREEWHAVLDKMIWSMKTMAEEKDYCPSHQDIREFYAKLDEGLELFGKHFRDLWY